MDINEPSLMDVAHDTINLTQGPALYRGLDYYYYILGLGHEQLLLLLCMMYRNLSQGWFLSV